MIIRTNPEVQMAIMGVQSEIPSELLEEFMTLAAAPTPKAAYQISQLLYLHRADLPAATVEVGAALIRFLVHDYQWSGFSEIGMAQLDYMQKALGVEDFQSLDDDDAPGLADGSGVTDNTPVEAPVMPDP